MLFVSLVTYLNEHYATTCIALVFSSFLFILAIFHPQKSFSHFVIDCTFTFFLLFLFICGVANSSKNPSIKSPLSSLSQLVSAAALAPHVIYLAGLVAFWLLVKKKLAQKVFKGIQKCCHHVIQKVVVVGKKHQQSIGDL